MSTATILLALSAKLASRRTSESSATVSTEPSESSKTVSDSNAVRIRSSSMTVRPTRSPTQFSLPPFCRSTVPMTERGFALSRAFSGTDSSAGATATPLGESFGLSSLQATKASKATANKNKLLLMQGMYIFFPQSSQSRPWRVAKYALTRLINHFFRHTFPNIEELHHAFLTVFSAVVVQEQGESATDI